MPDSDPNLNATFQLVSAPPASSAPAPFSSSAAAVGAGSHYVAQLALASVRHSQGGNYSCRPSNAGPVSVRLHLIDGTGVVVVVGSKSDLGRCSCCPSCLLLHLHAYLHSTRQ